MFNLIHIMTENYCVIVPSPHFTQCACIPSLSLTKRNCNKHPLLNGDAGDDVRKFM